MGSGGQRARRALSLTSWFWHPDVDMRGWEVLSRASACVVPTRDPHLPYKFHILAAAHVTHPYRFPRYYPVETHAFVHVLADEHIRCTLESRQDDTGSVTCKADLAPLSYAHPTLDVSVLHVKDEEALLAAMQNCGEELQLCTLAPRRAVSDDDLLFLGHVVRPSSEVEGVLVPTAVHGHVLGRSEHQVFARTATTLEMGMCGGPVVSAHNPSMCFGIVEGIVNPDTPNSEVPLSAAPSGGSADLQRRARSVLASAAVFAECDNLSAFLQRVEASMAAQLR